MFHFKNIRQYHSDLKNNLTTCEEAVLFYLDKIERLRSLNAIVEVFAREALERAKSLDQKRRMNTTIGKLHGVVITIKDVIGFKDHPTTAASATLQGFNAIRNADVVKKLLDEEAIIIGICNSDEFAMGTTNEHSFYGPAKNPINPDYTPGGSSGGSAAATGAGLCMISLGTDTGGSVRQPSDYCGLFGFKPSYGRFSSKGVIPYAKTFDQVGIIANNIDDIEITFDAVKENSNSIFPERNNDQHIDSKKLKVGFLKVAATHTFINKEIGTTTLDFFKKVEGRFSMIDDIQLRLIDYLVPTYYILTTGEAALSLNRAKPISEEDEPWQIFYKKNLGEQPGREVKKRIMLGSLVTNGTLKEDYYEQAQKVRHILMETMERVFMAFDYLLMPTVISTAPKLGEINKLGNTAYQSDIFTTLANLTGLPAISIPLFKHSNGMPFGIQVLSSRGNDKGLLEFAKVLKDK